MRVELSCGSTVWFIGDPHLGKRFENGVPLNRRGEREARQMRKFKDELETDADVIICVGDVFDHPQVSMATIIEAVDAIELAARRRPNVQFFMMAGNHDRSRQLNTVGAWEIFRRIIGGRLDNVFIVDTVGKVETIVFVPWEWGKPVAQAIEERFTKSHENVEVELVVLHHDLEAFGGNTDYMVPARLIMERFPNCQKIITGHWHLEGDYKIDGVDVACTGSLEPYTHAEDPNGELYVSLTLDELEARDPAELKDKCVRVFLRDGEELPVGLDCLQLTGKRITELEADPEASVAEKLGAFDWAAILDEHLKDVEPYVREFIDERLVHNG
jgi:DNA repair exonuclease SbcCD nuclease subunit